MKHIILIPLLLFSSLSLHAQGPQWIVYNTGNSGLPGNTVYSIAFEGNVKWFGTDKGLAKFENNYWTAYDTTNSNLPDNFVKIVRINDSGEKLIGTTHGGVALYDNVTWTIYDTSNSPLPHNWVFGADFDTSGNIWIATILGVAKTNGINWEIFNSNNVDSMTGPRVVKFDPVSNKIWIGTTTRGLFVYDDNVWARYTTLNSGLNSNQIRAVEIDLKDNIWIGTSGGGLDMFNAKKNNWIHLLSGFVFAISIDSSTNKWLGSPGGGLSKFNQDSILANFTPENSPLPSYGVNSIATDIYQNIWIGTDEGIAVYNETGVIGLNTSSQELPKEFELFQNHPNPFNPTTKINFEIPKQAFVVLKIYDITGREIKRLLNESKTPGQYSVTFDGSGLASGVYFYRLEAGDFIQTKRMLLVK